MDLVDSSPNVNIFKNLAPAHESPHAKITVVGVGQVGMACAFSLMVQNVASEICLVDVVPDKLKGEMMDLQHGLAFVKSCTIKADTDYAITAGSKICIITAGVRQQNGESRLSLALRNVDILKKIVPNLVKYSPNSILLVVSNPVDILTYIAWKFSGFPKERVIGSGTNLDSARFRFLISERLNIAPSSCHGWIIGEHGDSSVAVWSGVNVAGVHLQTSETENSDGSKSFDWELLHRKVIDSAYEIIRLKGYTSWAVGLSVASICYSIIRNTRNIVALSVNVNDIHGIANDVYLSLPSVIGENGVTDIVRQILDENELEKLQKSAAILHEIQANLLL